MGISAADLLRDLLVTAHQSLEATMADVTQELAQWQPEGLANPIGTTYAHVVQAEDVVTHLLVKGEPPLSSQDFAGRTGFDPAMPFPGLVHGDLGHWYKNASINLAELRDYAKVVQERSEQIVGSLTDEDLAREVDLSSVGYPASPLGWVLGVFLIGHINNIMGEISAIKGLNGLKGYPF